MSSEQPKLNNSEANNSTSGESPTAPQPKPIYLQEPMPFRKFHPTCGQSEWPRSGFARLAANHARQGGAAAWTFHTRQSFDLRSRTLVQILAADADQKGELEAVSAAAGSSSGG